MSNQDKGLPERRQTLRRRMLELLTERTCSVRDLSVLLHISEREALRHLPHVERTVKRQGGRLKTEPAVCRNCGFVFRKRERFTRPGRCPRCRGEAVEEPLFSVVRKG